MSRDCCGRVRWRRQLGESVSIEGEARKWCEKGGKRRGRGEEGLEREGRVVGAVVVLAGVKSLLLKGRKNEQVAVSQGSQCLCRNVAGKHAEMKKKKKGEFVNWHYKTETKTLYTNDRGTVEIIEDKSSNGGK